MHSLIILIALLGSVSAPEASTLPFPTSDLDQRAQDHNHSYGLITHGSSHGLMTHGLIPGSLPVDTLNQTTAQGSKDPQKVIHPDDFRLGEQCGGGRARGRIKCFQSFELNVSLHCTCFPCEYMHTVRHTLDWKSALHCRLKCTARCNLQAMLQSGKTEWSKINASTLYMGS